MSSSKQFPSIITVIAILVVCLTVIVSIVYLKTIHAGADMVKDTAKNFITGNITTTFNSSIPTVTSTHGNVLEVATAENTETIIKEDSLKSLWGLLDLGTTTSEIRVRVTYRYHILLSDSWQLAARGNVCLVCAPQFKASLPPAIHTDSIETKSERGWANFVGNHIDEMEAGLTDSLGRRAQDSAHLNFVREKCRMSVADFVKNWLIQKSQWTNTFDSIVVVFPDEYSFPTDQALSEFNGRPTIQIIK